MEAAKKLNMDIKPIELQTRRLLLRPLRGDDAPGMYAIYSDPQTMKYWSSVPISSLESAVQMVAEDLKLQLDDTAAFWAIVLPRTGRVIGKFTLIQIDRHNRRAEIGYVLNREFWRKGYGSEVLAAMLELFFLRFELHRLEADIDTDNIASIALLKKFGFRQEGLLRERWLQGDEWRDSVMMSLLSTHWHLARTR